MVVKELVGVERTDVRGSLETVEHLAQIGIIMIDMNLFQHIPTILEDMLEHIQRLVLEYAVVEDGKKDTQDEVPKL